MKLKKYIGNTMPEIMQKIRSELGPDAVILSTKKVERGGVFGLFTKKQLEVVAALDPEPMGTQNQQSTKEFNQSFTATHEQTQNNDTTILREINQLKKMIQTQNKNDIEFSPNYLLVYEYLKNQEVEESVAKKIIEDLLEQEESTKTENTEQIIANLKQHITQLLVKNNDQHSHGDQSQIIHFVGPTGVGKTTTLAKVAANSILQKNKKVAFITTDTYRIAAIDQLKTYAKILNVPIEVAYTKQDYLEAIEKFSSYDNVFVDTAGRNFREHSYVKGLKEMIDSTENSLTYLVLSLTAKQRDIIDVFNEFQLLQIKNVIFTKTDETRQYGSILNIALKNDVNIKYLTNGQDVPNDLIIPTAKDISELILGAYFNE